MIMRRLKAVLQNLLWMSRGYVRPFVIVNGGRDRQVDREKRTKVGHTVLVNAVVVVVVYIGMVRAEELSGKMIV